MAGKGFGVMKRENRLLTDIQLDCLVIMCRPSALKQLQKIYKRDLHKMDPYVRENRRALMKRLLITYGIG